MFNIDQLAAINEGKAKSAIAAEKTKQLIHKYGSAVGALKNIAANYKKDNLEIVQYIFDAYGLTSSDREKLAIVEVLRIAIASAIHDKNAAIIVRHLIENYGEDRAIIQAITQFFSLPRFLGEHHDNNWNLAEKIFFTEAVVQYSDNFVLLEAIANPELLAFLVQLQQNRQDRPSHLTEMAPYLKTITILLNEAKDKLDKLKKETETEIDMISNNVLAYALKGAATARPDGCQLQIIRYII